MIYIYINKLIVIDYSNQIIEKYNTYNTLKQQSALNKIYLILLNRLKLSMIASFYKMRHILFTNNHSQYLIIKQYINADSPERVCNPQINHHPISHKKNNSLSNQHSSYFASRNTNQITNNKQRIVTASLKIANSHKILDHKNSSLIQFYLNQEKYINNHKDKITALRLKQMEKVDLQCTFQPYLENIKRIKKSHTIDTFNHQPRYIKLNKDAIEHQKKIHQLKRRLKSEEKDNNKPYRHSKSNSNHYLNNTYLLDVPSDIYYEKLYQDAYELQLRKNEIEKQYYRDLTFQPHNYNNNTIEIKSTFEERNNKLLDFKKNHQLLKEKEQIENDMKLKEKRPLKTQIEENNKNVINRLYKKHFDKNSNCLLTNKPSSKSRGHTEIVTLDGRSNVLKSQEITTKANLKNFNSKLTDRNHNNNVSGLLLKQLNDQIHRSHPNSYNSRTVNNLITQTNE